MVGKALLGELSADAFRERDHHVEQLAPALGDCLKIERRDAQAAVLPVRSNASDSGRRSGTSTTLVGRQTSPGQRSCARRRRSAHASSNVSAGISLARTSLPSSFIAVTKNFMRLRLSEVRGGI